MTENKGSRLQYRGTKSRLAKFKISEPGGPPPRVRARIALGGISIGVIALGGLALGALALGGLAAGGVAAGRMSLDVVSANASRDRGDSE
jgi:hypothetical protein